MTKPKTEPADLPDNLSDLLELSVNDAVACDRSRKYALSMGHWHKPNGVCKVCMAGAVMVQTKGYRGGIEVEDPSEMDDIDTDDGERYLAINNMREGEFEAAADKLGLEIPSEVIKKAEAALGMVDAPPSWYKQDGDVEMPESFTKRGARCTWTQYLHAAKILRANGY